MNLNELAQQGEPQDPAMAPGQTEQAAKQPASPEQQAQFDMLLGRARQIMGETAEEWMQALKLDPVATAVKFGTQTLRHLAQQSEQAQAMIRAAAPQIAALLDWVERQQQQNEEAA